MNHNDIRHKLSDYIDGEVTAGEKAEIEEHLKACTRCSDALAELRKTIEQVKQIEDAEPPAWMTQKIMARVRDEARQKKSIFHRLFYPLAIKLPVQAVAVLFLAVTAFYIYRSIQPEMKYAEAPVSMSETKKEAPSAGTAESPPSPNPLPAEERTEVRGKAVIEPKRSPQVPGYKSLDMKYEYEKPAPPAPQEQPPAPAVAAPSPMKKELARSAKDEAALDKFAAEPKAKAVAPQVMAEQAGRSASLIAKEEAQQITVAPRFEDYPAIITSQEKAAPVDFTSHPRAKQFKTMIMEGVKKGPNFAGHYTLATWGCGTSCAAFAIIDRTTGKVYFPPLLSHISWAGWWEKEYGLKFRVDSNLLIVYGSPNEQDEKGVFYYLWKDNDLKLIKSDIHR